MLHCGGASRVLFPGGVTQQTVVPQPDSSLSVCSLDSHVLWGVTLFPTLQPMESVVLPFEVDRSGAQLADGNYSNEAWAEPGDDNTRIGMTAPVTVGTVDEDEHICAGTESGVTVTKVVSQIMDIVPGGASLPSDTFQLTVEYTIEIEDVGPDTLNLGPSGATAFGIRDLLPLEFCFLDWSVTFHGTGIPH